MASDTKKHKVIVMVQSPLTTRWASYFCTDALSPVFDLEYWDCSKVAYPAFAASDILERPYTVTISSMAMLRENLRRLPSDALLLSDIHFNHQNLSFHKLVGKYISNCISLDMWCYSLGMVPLEEVSKDIVTFKRNRIKDFIYKSDILRLLIKFVRFHGDARFQQEWNRYKQNQSIRKEEKEVNDCKKCYKYTFEITTKPHQTYSILHPDAEKYFKLRNQKSLRTDRYVVYLDQYFPLHPDIDEMEPEVHHATLAPGFFLSINRFFSEIEKQLDCKVVIAAHPVADYRKNPFDGREIVYYKSAELVKDSIGVCLHHTASANFIALFDKPFVLLECDTTYQSPRFTANMRSFANVLGAPIYNMDRSCDDIKKLFHKMDPQRRAYFMNSFIDTTVTKTNEELIPMHLERIYNRLFGK